MSLLLFNIDTHDQINNNAKLGKPHNIKSLEIIH